MATDRSEEVRIPLVEEQLTVGKRQAETDRVRVRTVVDTLDTPIEALLRVGRLDIERLAVDRETAEAPPPYQDGDTLVISIVEERLVVEKRLFVVEEVRVTQSSHEEAVSTSMPLRRTRAVIERDDIDPPGTGQT